MEKLFRAIDVWKRTSRDQLVRYRCFQMLPEGKFCVQSKDYYHLPLDDKQTRNLEVQFLELLFEESPDIRAGLYPTLEEAISVHDKEFGSPGE